MDKMKDLEAELQYYKAKLELERLKKKEEILEKFKKMNMKELKIALGTGLKGKEYKAAMKEYLRRTHK